MISSLIWRWGFLQGAAKDLEKLFTYRVCCIKGHIDVSPHGNGGIFCNLGGHFAACSATKILAYSSQYWSAWFYPVLILFIQSTFIPPVRDLPWPSPHKPRRNQERLKFSGTPSQQECATVGGERVAACCGTAGGGSNNENKRMGVAKYRVIIVNHIRWSRDTGGDNHRTTYAMLLPRCKQG